MLAFIRLLIFPGKNLRKKEYRAAINWKFVAFLDNGNRGTLGSSLLLLQIDYYNVINYVTVSLLAWLFKVCAVFGAINESNICGLYILVDFWLYLKCSVQLWVRFFAALCNILKSIVYIANFKDATLRYLLRCVHVSFTEGNLGFWLIFWFFLYWVMSDICVRQVHLAIGLILIWINPKLWTWRWIMNNSGWGWVGRKN